MDTLTAVAVSFLATLGVLYLAGSVLEFIFRRELRQSVLIIDADPALVTLLCSTRCVGLVSGYPKTIVLCRQQGESASCKACPHTCAAHEKSEGC